MVGLLLQREKEMTNGNKVKAAGKKKTKMPFATANGKANNPKGKKPLYATTKER
jgi:hypothetical protein